MTIMQRATLYILVGYPGSGKTTASLIIRELTGAEHLWADFERKRMFARPSHSQAESRELYDRLNQRVEQLLESGQSVVFDTNFNFYKDRQLMRDIAKRRQADCKLLWIQTDPELAYKRASQDIDKQPTRILGEMPRASFQRITNHLQAPTEEERPIILDGTRITHEYIADKLGLKDPAQVKV